LVSRIENPEDRRQKSVDITELGLALLDKMFSCEQEADTLLNNLTAEEVKELNRMLDKIREKKE
jgi:DNA-binding MarR family transcriptional regulator